MFKLFSRSAVQSSSSLEAELKTARSDIALLQDLLHSSDEIIESLTEAFGLLKSQHKQTVSQATLTIAALVSMYGGEVKLTKDLLESVGAIPNLGVNISVPDAEGAKVVKLVDMAEEQAQAMATAAATESTDKENVDFDEKAMECDCSNSCSRSC